MKSYTLLELIDLLNEGVYSSVDLVTMYLDQIKQYDTQLNSIAELNPDALSIAKKMDEERKIKNRGLAVVSKGKGATKTPSLDEYKYQSGATPQRSRPTIESRSSQSLSSRGVNLEKANKRFDEQMAEAERRVSAGLRNRKGGEYDLGTGKKADLPNSKAIGEAARKRPGLRKRKEESIQQSRARATAAMTKRGMTPAEKKTAVMKARAKARKIVKNTGAQ
jgi:hypothetical protein